MQLSDEAYAFLDRHPVARLATAGADGAPHLVPVCFARVGEHLYFVADDKPKRRGPRALRRLANLAVNPRAALLVDDYDDDWTRLAYLLVHVDTGPVDDPVEYDAALAALRARYPAYRGMPLVPASHPITRLTPHRWHLWRSAAG